MDSNTSESSTIPTEQILPIRDSPLSSTPVEMTKFDEQAAEGSISPIVTLPQVTGLPNSSSIPEVIKNTTEDPERDVSNVVSTSNPDILAQEPLASTSSDSPASPILAPGPLLTREKTAPAIGPSSDRPTPTPKESEILGPVLTITLLLTNGARHPYKIDGKYLKKRNVTVDNNNPINMSTYTLKELIWREWRDEWEVRPSSPSSIRLIYYGKLLDDKMRLDECKFVIGPTAHVVHMTIKPQDIVDEEDAKMAKSGSRDRDGNERSPRCRCVIL